MSVLTGNSIFKLCEPHYFYRSDSEPFGAVTAFMSSEKVWKSFSFSSWSSSVNPVYILMNMLCLQKNVPFGDISKPVWEIQCNTKFWTHSKHCCHLHRPQAGKVYSWETFMQPLSVPWQDWTSLLSTHSKPCEPLSYVGSQNCQISDGQYTYQHIWF